MNDNKLNLDTGYIKGYDNIINFFSEHKDDFLNPNKLISFDIETKDLSMRGNKLLGFGIAFSSKYSRYISVRDLTDSQIKKIFELFNRTKCKIILHNAYFDISQITYMTGVKVRWTYCTYIMAHAIYSHLMLYAEKGKRKDTLSLKSLCKKAFPELYGYEDDLNQIKKEICKIKGIKEGEFTYDMFSDDVLSPYGNYDVLVTYALFEYLSNKVGNRIENGWEKLPELLELKHNVTRVYIKAKVNGIKVDRDMILKLNIEWNEKTDKLLEEIKKDDRIKTAEAKIYLDKMNKLLQKRQDDFDNKLEERLEKIKIGKYSEKRLAKARENINNLTQKMLDKIEKESKFNLKSSQHKQVLFIDVMELNPLKYNKDSGSPKLDKEFLASYSYIPLVDQIREYALFIKGIDGFLGVNDEEGKKGLWNNTFEDYPYNHPNSNLQGTITHRVAQNNINLQQLPSRGELSTLKKCIIPLKENHRIITLDYSSCELYILAALSNEKNFLNAIEHNLDLHSNMAYMIWGEDILLDKDNGKICEILGVEQLEYENDIHSLKNVKLSIEDKLKIIKELYGDTYRYNAKSINFGVPYSIGAKGLAENMKKNIKEASQMLNTYMERNVGIDSFMTANKDFLCENGYIEGKHGQRLYMYSAKGYDWKRLLESKYHKKDYDYNRLKELRKSTNYIIQSENAMVIYKALINLDKRITELGLEDKIFLMTTIYDAVYLSVDNSISDEYMEKMLREIFEDYYMNGVSFRIDFSSGATFKDL